MRNKEWRHIIYTIIIMVVVVTIVNVIASHLIFEQYKQTLIQQNERLIGSIIYKYPELEEEFITILLNPHNEIQPGVLEKYGLHSLENMEYLESYRELKTAVYAYQNTWVYGILLVTIGIFIIIVYRIFKRIRQIHEFSSGILRSDYSVPIQNYEEGDISQITTDLHKIMVALKQQRDITIQDKKYLEEVLSDISHQLKTPLTSMYVINDLLTDDKLVGKRRQEFLQKNKKQLEKIEWLVSSLLKLSRLDSGTISLKKEEVTVGSLVTDALQGLLVPIEIKKQTVQMKGIGTISVKVDSHWTMEAITNIIKNAHEHTGEGKTITITYEENPLYVSIFITDEGEGIAKEDMPHLFKRFYKSKTNSKESIGIGLHMAKKIMAKQNGDIFVQSKKGEGTTFVLQFYKNIL